MRRGVLPYCVLAMLRDGERYGFELVQALGEVGGMVTSQGTIYPLLARLRGQGLVGTSWRESGAGPPRRYYHLTAAGQAALAGFSRDWAQLRDGVGLCLPGAATRNEGHAMTTGQPQAANWLEARSARAAAAPCLAGS